MLQSGNSNLSRGCLLTTLLLLFVVAPIAAASEEERRVHIETIETEDCHSGEICADRHHAVVFVGDDGARVIRHAGYGGPSVWVERHHGLHHDGARLGLQLSEITPELRTHFGVEDDAGVLVSKVVDGSPAFIAGLEVGDVVTAVDGEPVASIGGLIAAIHGREEGDEISLEVWRQGRIENFTAVLTGRPEAARRLRSVLVDCDSQQDCTVDLDGRFDFEHFDCDGAAECEIRVDCSNGDCSCTANGTLVECRQLHR